MLFICYEKCSTCKKAEKYLVDHHVNFEKRDIKTQNPSVEELKEWHKKSNLPLKKFFNTSGLVYQSLALKDKLPLLSEEAQFALLASDGMLVKRPLLVVGNTVLVGFKEEEYQKYVSV